MDTTKTITHLSLCSGYEGIGLGLRRIFPNLREIAYVEREGFVAANLVAKMEEGKLDAAPVHTDVKTFPYRKFRGKVSILSGGFPCQGFSQAGKQKGVNDPRHLFPYIAEGIRECEPRICFLENVQGILSCNTNEGEPVLKYVLRTLEEMGYRATAGIFSAEEVGAPHQRKRVFILGYTNRERFEGERLLRTKRRGESTLSWWTSEEIARVGEEYFEFQEEGELVNSDSRRLEGSEEEGRNRGNALRTGEEELGNASDIRPREHSSDSRETSTDQSGEERRVYEPQRTGSLSGYGSQSQDSQELANSYSRRGEVQNQGQLTSEQVLECNGSSWRAWPSRPGEAQYEWEEPRVVGDTKNFSSNVSEDNRELSQSTNGESRRAAGQTINRGQTEPQLGGATNGYNSRVDRLRLLGNGVVPATAARAFSTLIQRVI